MGYICIQDREESEEVNSVHEPPKEVSKASARLGSGSTSIKLLRGSSNINGWGYTETV